MAAGKMREVPRLQLLQRAGIRTEKCDWRHEGLGRVAATYAISGMDVPKLVR